MNDFRIEFDKPTGGRVFMNGQELDGVRAFGLEARADNAVVVTLELYARSVNGIPTNLDSIDRG